MRNRSRGWWKIDGMSRHNGRMNVPGRRPRSCGRLSLGNSLVRLRVLGPSGGRIVTV